MLLTVLLVLHIMVCVALIGIVLMQRSEGGALGMGGGPSGFMTARGAGDLLTRTTWILFAAFLTLSLGLTLLNARTKNSSAIADRLRLAPAGANPLATRPPVPGQVPGQLPGQAAPSAIPGFGPAQAPPPAIQVAPGSQLRLQTNPGLGAAPSTPAPAPAAPAKPAAAAKK